MTPAEDRTPSPTQQWAQTILGDEGPWTIFAIDANGDRHTRLLTSIDNLDPAKMQRVDAWIGMARRRPDFKVVNNGRGKSEDCVSIKSVWLDIDGETLAEYGPGTATPKRIEDLVRTHAAHVADVLEGRA